MKLARIRSSGRPHLAIIEGDVARFFGIAAGEWIPFLTAMERFSFRPIGELPLEAVEFLPPIGRPGQILCVGANYEGHRREMGRERPDHPLLFSRSWATLRGHRAPLFLPPESSQLDYEGEVAIVIGRDGRRISASAAWDHVAGLSPFNDATLRDWQRHTSQFLPGKNFAATGGFGPWITTLDEVSEPTELRLETRVNGELRQAAPLSDLTFSIPELIAYVSTFTPLTSGDVLVTGTPSGVGHAMKPPAYLTEGDQVEVSVSGLGTLLNPVEAERVPG